MISLSFLHFYSLRMSDAGWKLERFFLPPPLQGLPESFSTSKSFAALKPILLLKNLGIFVLLTINVVHVILKNLI